MGWRSPLLAQLTWLCPEWPPSGPCRCLLEGSLCYRPSELPTAAGALYKHRHILQNSSKSQAWTWDDPSKQSPWWVHLKASSDSLLLLLFHLPLSLTLFPFFKAWLWNHTNTFTRYEFAGGRGGSERFQVYGPSTPPLLEPLDHPISKQGP